MDGRSIERRSIERRRIASPRNRRNTTWNHLRLRTLLCMPSKTLDPSSRALDPERRAPAQKPLSDPGAAKPMPRWPWRSIARVKRPPATACTSCGRCVSRTRRLRRRRLHARRSGRRLFDCQSQPRPDRATPAARALLASMRRVVGWGVAARVAASCSPAMAFARWWATPSPSRLQAKAAFDQRVLAARREHVPRRRRWRAGRCMISAAFVR